MDLRRLRHLIAVAEHGTIVRAAQLFATSRNRPCSSGIQALEAEVGARLLDRRPSGIELTEMGRVVLRHAMALDARVPATSTAMSASRRASSSASCGSASGRGAAPCSWPQ